MGNINRRAKIDSSINFQAGQGIIEFLAGLAILVLIALGLIWGISKLAIMIKENFRDVQEPTLVPLDTPTPDETRLPTTILHQWTTSLPTAFLPSVTLISLTSNMQESNIHAFSELFKDAKKQTVKIDNRASKIIS